METKNRWGILVVASLLVSGCTQMNDLAALDGGAPDTFVPADQVVIPPLDGKVPDPDQWQPPTPDLMPWPDKFIPKDVQINKCAPAASRTCPYTGPAGTEGKGVCQAGIQTCIDPAKGLWGTCTGEVTPKFDDCDGLDNDCDGKADELCSSLVLHLTGDTKGSGINIYAEDKSGKAHHGTPMPYLKGPTSVPGKVGKAFSLNGIDQYVKVADHVDFQAMKSGFTVMAWARWTTVGERRYVFHKLDDQPGIFSYYGSMRFFIDQKGNGITTGKVVTNTWIHLAMVYNGSTLTAYIDGIAVSKTITSSPGGEIKVGGDGVTGRYFEGLIDEVMVYTTPLSAAEVKLYIASTAGSP